MIPIPNMALIKEKETNDKNLLITLSKIGSFTLISAPLVLSIIQSPPSQLPYKPIDFLLLLLLSILLPYLITSIQALLDYKPFNNKEVVKKLKKLSGFKRIWLLHKKSKKLSLFARGTPFLPIILIKGDTSTLTEDELLATLCHEAYHNRLWHFQISFFLLTSLIYLLKPFGPLGLIFAFITSKTISTRYEFYADRFASQKVSKEALHSALKKIDKPLPQWLNLIPVLNLLTSYPSAEERLNALK